MSIEHRVAHLKGASTLEPKCGAADASIVTNWIVGATYHEIYVPADVLQRADVVCERCQNAALADDAGSDDEVVPDTEDSAADPAVVESDPALVEISDKRLLRELERRLADEQELTQEESDQTADHRD